MPFADPPEKPMVIIQISAVVTGQYPYQRETIYGLGDNNSIYRWNQKSGEWILHKEDSCIYGIYRWNQKSGEWILHKEES